jgi:hypothetical protein
MATERNWKVVGLSPENTVLTDGELGRKDTNEPPSAYLGIEYLSRTERGILRRGVTAERRAVRAARLRGRK